jgi:hypothetical protein
MRRIGSNWRAEVARKVLRWSGQPQASWIVPLPAGAATTAGLAAGALAAVVDADQPRHHQVGGQAVRVGGATPRVEDRRGGQAGRLDG